MVSPHHEPPKIPGFRHRRLIGVGGSSDVFLYEWRQEKVNVVVKVWHESLGVETHGAVAQETKDVAELVTHPYVLPMHAVGVTSDDRSFVVMDYRAGGDLDTCWLTERVSVEEALSLTIKVAGALDVAARHGILHGDVKPANILLTGTGVPQLSGFGSLSTAGRSSGAWTSLPWMAPEMLEDPPEPTAWADIWSLAATCYTLLAGRTPFEGPNTDNPPEAVVERIREYDPLPIGRDDVPVSLERALRKAMYKTRAGRHWSAADLAKALQAVEEELGLPITSLADMHEAPSYTTEVEHEDLFGAELDTTPDAGPGIEAEVEADVEPDTDLDVETDVPPEAPQVEGPTGEPTDESAEMIADPPADADAATQANAEAFTPARPRKPEATAETHIARPGATGAGGAATGEWVTRPPGSAPTPAPAVSKVPGLATYSVAFAPDPDPVSDLEPDLDEESESDSAQELEPTSATAPRPEPATAPTSEPVSEPAQVAAPEPVSIQDRMDRDDPAIAEDTAEVPIVVAPAPSPMPAPLPGETATPEDSAWIDHEDDLLGHRGDVDRLARLLVSTHTQLPVSVAVQGLPGSGRSTFLRTLQERIEQLVERDDAHPRRARHVRVDARRHAGGDVASRMLESVRSEAKIETPPLVVKLRAAQQRRAQLRDALAGLPEDDGQRGKRKPQPMTTTTALEAVDREVAAAESALRAAPPGPPPGSPAGPAETTIVYVDDLDRCDPVTAAGVLQAIDDLSTQPGVAVVAAVDVRTLQRTIAGGVADPASYLSRVFDVPFALRAFVGDPAVRFMRSLMRQAVPSWPSVLAAAGAEKRSARRGTVESVEISPGEALFTSELARFCATPRGARKLLTLYRLARSAPVTSSTTGPSNRHALGILMAILVGAPAQADRVLGAVVESLATGEDGTTFRKLLESVAREHTVGCGRATCGPCTDWSRVIRAYTDIARVYQVPQEVAAYADWVDEVARFSLPT